MKRKRKPELVLRDPADRIYFLAALFLLGLAGAYWGGRVVLHHHG